MEGRKKENRYERKELMMIMMADSGNASLSQKCLSRHEGQAISDVEGNNWSLWRKTIGVCREIIETRREREMENVDQC